MALKRQACSNHPDRMAIGVCVITKEPICAECSTRYEGVNYSKEGLKILQSRRAEERRKAHQGSWAVTILALALSPLGLYLMFTAYRIMFALVIDLHQIDLGILLEAN